ncbi:MAG: UDP-2,3-diacylglucosamine diphosphatase [bacterium]|nr:UDP-2,3-diacylglucosamine diphosphatase [bacterium]
MKTIVFSDVHLDVDEAARPQMNRFVAFLRSIDPRDTERVVVLGDLFDFWFEYRHVAFSGYFDVVRAFADLHDQGVELYFVCGNHDFWAGRFLRDQIGFHIERDRLQLTVNGARALFVHGDGINKRDVGYRAYKWVAQARPVVWLFGLLHPDWAMAIAQRVSRTSRRMTKSDDVSKGSEVGPIGEFARASLAAGDADVVMCGHTHHPVREEHPTPDGTGIYVNCGDWLWHQSYVVWDDAGVRLERYLHEAADPVAQPETQGAVHQAE